jgi:hypothetical protein
MTIVSPSRALFAYPCLSLKPVTTSQDYGNKQQWNNASVATIVLPFAGKCSQTPKLCHCMFMAICGRISSVTIYRMRRYIECSRQSNCCMIGTFCAQWLMDVTWRWSYVVVLFSRNTVIVTVCLDMGSSRLYSVLWKVGVSLQDKTKINILQ